MKARRHGNAAAGGMADVREQKLIRLSAARAKIRAGYAALLEVCVSSFAAGVVVFMVSVGVYFCVSQANPAESGAAGFAEEVSTLAEFFRLRSFEGKSASHGEDTWRPGVLARETGRSPARRGVAKPRRRKEEREEPEDSWKSEAIMSLGMISGAFGVLGMIAGMILRLTIRKEPSDRFFRRKVRIPLHLLPFVGFFTYAGVAKPDLIAVYLAGALAAAYLWRFWYRIVLSVVSTFDVNRFVPKPVSRRQC